MLLGNCSHCAAPLPIRGNRTALLLRRSYFCRHCGHPGPRLMEALVSRLRRDNTKKDQVRITEEKTPAALYQLK